MSEPVTETNTELDALAAEAAAVDAANAPQVAQPVTGTAEAVPEAAAVDREAEAAMLLNIARPLLGMFIPGIKDAPNQEWDELRGPVAGLLDHYAVDMGGVLGSPWAKLVVAAVPLGMRAIEAWNNEEKPKQAITGTPADAIEAISQQEGARPVFAAEG